MPSISSRLPWTTVIMKIAEGSLHSDDGMQRWDWILWKRTVIFLRLFWQDSVPIFIPSLRHPSPQKTFVHIISGVNLSVHSDRF